MTIEEARIHFLLDREAKRLDGPGDIAGQVAAWHLRQLAGGLMARLRGGQEPLDAVVERHRAIVIKTAGVQDPAAQLEYEALWRIVDEERERKHANPS